MNAPVERFTSLMAYMLFAAKGIAAAHEANRRKYQHIADDLRRGRDNRDHDRMYERETYEDYSR